MKMLASDRLNTSVSQPARLRSPALRLVASARSEILDGVTLAPTSVDEALEALELVASRLRDRNDARAVFPDVYAVITRKVKEAIEGRGPAFLEPQWISRLAGFFCEYYLAALAASLDGRATASAAWDVAFEQCDELGAPASIHAVLGINAHINYDLAQGLYENIVQHGAVHDQELLRRYRHDHDLVNEILAAAMPEIFQILVTRYGCPLAALATVTRGVQETISRAVMFTLRQWRDRVWDDLEALLAASSDQGRRCGVLSRMNKKSALVARAFATGNGALAAGRPFVRSAVRALPFAA
jgi:hypothetical protein